ncbi:hypothetical protein niasHT_031140 [Heterodera trifolii]|uniref:Zinc finger C2H2 LYAR-type domain-containing protein n=1 Tax=Heterodera trifolii TaxID=157864 RepID=A0ABD2ISA6_9BILA
MVFFICDQCGETMKKKQVLQHIHRCRNAHYSCMDCQVVFDKNSYQAHTKCITEDQKYGGARHVPKVNKGEQKQDVWVSQVRAAIRQVDEPRLKNLLRSVQCHTNIPRKEAKFVNFLQNSLRIRDRALCVDAWNAIKRAADAAAAKAKRTTAEGDAVVTTAAEEEETAEHNGDDADKSAPGQTNNAAMTTENTEGQAEEEKMEDETAKRANKMHQELSQVMPMKRKKGTHIKFDE